MTSFINICYNNRLSRRMEPRWGLSILTNRPIMWLYATDADSLQATITVSAVPNIVLYDYHNSRAGRCAVDFFGGYNSYLQVDGYQGYEQAQTTLVGCWAHARRKFMEVKKWARGKGSGKADWALNHIQKLYRVEALLK